MNATEKHRIFPEYKDYFNWDKQLEYSNYWKDSDSIYKEECKRAFRTLKKYFAGAFTCESEILGHPLGFTLCNDAPWCRQKLIWMADALHAFSERKNFRGLVERLASRHRYLEGIAVLDAATSFHSNGLVVDFDSKIIAHDKPKEPDMEVNCKETSELFYCEVANLEKSQNQTKNEKLLDPSRFRQLGNQYSGYLSRDLSPLHYNQIDKEIEEKIGKAIGECSFQQVYHEGIIDIAFSHSKEQAILDDWCKKRKLKVGKFYLPSTNFNPSQRVRNKIQKEQMQVPANHSNILVIKSNESFSWNLRKDSFIHEIEESVYYYEHILAVVLYDRHWGSLSEDYFQRNMSYFGSKLINDIEVDNVFVVFNRFSKVKLSPLLLGRILNSFIPSYNSNPPKEK